MGLLMVKSENSIGKLELSEEEKGKFVRKIIFFIERYLPDFQVSERIRNENKVTSDLVNFLNFKAITSNQSFIFQNQTPEKKNFTIDFGTIVFNANNYHNNSVYSVEAKKLPARSREYDCEYVYGTLGAIERFKLGKHGAMLLDVGIIAYILDNTFEFWFNSVNSWIRQCITEDKEQKLWQNDDLLSEFISQNNDTKRFFSVCKRINSITDSVKITHFWIKLN
jgi:hypothetical protein